ncbi:fumarylacetoacetate hydrolase family protein [Acetobacter sp. TBRC 12305]|uniref:Fumarylacetoacetate hydrolase family protein n=1 Tax=Acetobacter garciniae TaxID=2817435 RepID=A0A939HRP4_9PROT|nr:fumarylacetoacetate hydrolase family protein [Acetobacter garciniae]MBX0346236.1 fumarylacetoacetate hydrolase family protein [Acetobacter garciniae]
MPFSKDHIYAAATRLLAAAATKTPCAPIRDLLGPDAIDDAYAVQQQLVREYLAAGRRQVGHKIGLTALSVQKALGVDRPDFGILLDDMAFPEGAEIAFDHIMQPKVEAEIAFVLGRDLPKEGTTLADVIRATDYVLPALEIVGSRIENWDIRIADTIADNASSGAFVLGAYPRTLTSIDLQLCGMVIERRGEPVSTGVGMACLGSPLNAVAWLARTMVRHGTPLRAGDIVLSGALGPMVNVTAGDFFEARIEGLGSVSVGFSA